MTEKKALKALISLDCKRMHKKSKNKLYYFFTPHDFSYENFLILSGH